MDRNRILKIVILLLMAGVLLCIYLYGSKFLSGSVLCPTAGCEVVDSSPYSYIFGIPISLWGLLYYVGMLVIALIYFKNQINELVKKLYFVGVIWGIIFTAYLRYVEIVRIQAFCIWCWVSVVIVLALAYYSWRLYKLQAK